jgi:cupin 2 domain-containing protein
VISAPGGFFICIRRPAKKGDLVVNMGNFFEDIPDRLREEIFTTLVESGGVRIEKIISDAHASPEGFWYDQEENEWVMVLRGSAAIRFAMKDEEVLVLKPGDWVDIPAHVRHRVEWTDADDKTVWVAVFYQAKSPG